MKRWNIYRERAESELTYHSEIQNKSKWNSADTHGLTDTSLIPDKIIEKVI